MKTKLILFIFLLNSLNPLFSQSQLCGTPQPTNPTVYPPQDSSIQARGSSSSICVNVYFHIIRNTNGTNAFIQPNLDLVIKKLNEYYSPQNILINNGGISYIDNSALLDISVNEARNINDVENKNSFINYYIVQDMDYNGFALNSPSNALFIKSSRIYTSTSAHELGHCLGLYHTHKGLAYNESGCSESINYPSNCNTCGDLVCDTPADNGEVNTNGYAPDLTNIMSYFHLYGYNRDHFTNGQGYRMRYAIQNESVLQNITSNSCTTISEVNNVCYPQTKTVTLSNLGNATTIWTSSSNVEIISSNDLSAEVRAVNSYINGSNGWIKATINNGIVFQENFEVGVPSVSLITLESFRSSPIFTGRFTNITARYNGVIDVGQVGYTWEWVVPSSQVRNHGNNISYIHVSPIGTPPSIYIKTRAKNECGCSNWKGNWFTVQVAPEDCIDCPTDGSEVHY